ncbi:AAA domain-containing protein [Paraburkholderia caledonica]|uniref:AAA domain-containing protein n=1 Tax=Paraburkholderia caledonica TaxID=134536 RepID=UPI0015C68653|nr:AAA domain-containing protein [Paraburkholderia caledonica]
MDGKYEITHDRYNGGMSAVCRATDLQDKLDRAIKVSLPGADYARSALSVERERRALSDLCHPNIVQLFDSGNIADTAYLVLEWLPGGDLVKRIHEQGPASWSDFYESLGRPLLRALAYAHQRQWAHRDLKPQNVLFDGAGLPKIVDFGIARSTNLPQIGLTFFQSGSPPYTPDEADDGYYSARRDIYSWAAIAMSCLVGQVFHTKEELRLALDGLRELSGPKGILQKALAASPDQRQEAATVLLADLDAYHAAALTRVRIQTQTFLRLGRACIDVLRTEYSALEEGQCAPYVIDDLNSGWTAAYDARTGIIQIVGATIRLRGKVGDHDLSVDQLTVHTPDRAREIRETQATVPGVSFRADSVRDVKSARDDLRTFIGRLEIMDDVLANQLQEKERSFWFDCWSEFLREKERLYKTRQKNFLARRIDDEEEFLVATIDGDFDRDELGASLVLQTAAGKPVILTVVDVQADQVKLFLRSGKRADVPRANAILQTNFEAERKSLQKQRAALEDIRAGRAVSPLIGSVLSDPGSAEPPEPAGLQFPEHLSDDKRQVLDKAMEVSSLLVVNGPPGTGKTTLIAELISAYLKRYPARRILLSSQTHVALDHIIAKLDEKGLAEDVVRIVSLGSENSHKVNKSVERLTLERKVKDWCLKAEARSEEFMETYAERKGISAYEVKVELLGRSYIKTRGVLNVLREREKRLKGRELEINDRRLQKIEDGQVPDTHEILRQTEETLTEEDDLRRNIDSIEARLSRTWQSLEKLDGLGSVFSDAEDCDLESLLDSLVTTNSARKDLLPLMQLHLDWLNRLGSERSFHGAVLREARIVAGTCIGLGSTPAFQQDEYDLCIVDEASKATATETLVPMSRSRRSILVGDPKQLPPHIESAGNENGESPFSVEAKESLLSILLSRLPSENVEELVEQRRMCNTIGSLVSEVFYDRKLKNVREDDERNPIIVHVYPKAVTWLSTSKKPQRAETETSGKTFENRTEVHEIIEQLKAISRQTRKAQKPVEVAVVAAYSAQVALLRDQIAQQIGVHSGFKIEVNTVDAFQGREADICLYSVTRSNSLYRIGFQREKERLNVALSRARDALVIVGDADFCHGIKGKNPFRDVIDYIRANPDFCLQKDL